MTFFTLLLATIILQAPSSNHLLLSIGISYAPLDACSLRGPDLICVKDLTAPPTLTGQSVGEMEA